MQKYNSYGHIYWMGASVTINWVFQGVTTLTLAYLSTDRMHLIVWDCIWLAGHWNLNPCWDIAAKRVVRHNSKLQSSNNTLSPNWLANISNSFPVESCHAQSRNKNGLRKGECEEVMLPFVKFFRHKFNILFQIWDPATMWKSTKYVITYLLTYYKTPYDVMQKWARQTCKLISNLVLN